MKTPKDVPERIWIIPEDRYAGKLYYLDNQEIEDLAIAYVPEAQYAAAKYLLELSEKFFTYDMPQEQMEDLRNSIRNFIF
jgi:hypothetical protein